MPDMKRLLTAILVSCVLAGCATNPVTGEQDFVLMSEKDEIAVGQQANQQVLQQYAVYDDVELQNYVQYVGAKVAAKSHRPELSYHFTVLDSKEVNAFALPGGYIYVTRGLMSYLNTEAQLAAVLGHEVGHVTARHAVRQHSATQLTSIGTAIGAAFIPGLGQAGYQLAGVLGTALLRGYGREHELEADRLGAEYLARTGYDSGAMLEVVKVLKSQELFEFKLAKAEGREPHVYHGLFSTHPDNDTRLQEVIANAGKVAPVSSPYVGREDYLQRTNGLVYGESTHQGLIKGRDFYHGPLGFAIRFPPGWQIRNLSDYVAAIAPGSGAIVQLNRGRADPRLSPRDYLMNRLGLKQFRSDRPLTIHGLPAHTGTAAADTGNGQILVRATVIYMGNTPYIVSGWTPDPGAIGRYDGSFLDTAGSFRPLAPEERKLAGRVQRITLVKADKQTTFDSLAQASPLEQFQEQQIRLINARYPRGDIQPGEMIKTVK